MNQRTILIVDDNPWDREIFSRYLTHSNDNAYRVLVADSGKAALVCLHHETPDCILLDCGMLNMDGLALLAVLKDGNDLQHYPVIMLTGFDSAAKAVDAMKLGAQDYLTKDVVTAESLLIAIDYAIDNHVLQCLRERRRCLVEAQRKELQASEHLLEEAQQVARVGSWEMDLGTQKLTWSKEMFRLLDIAPEQGEPDLSINRALFAPADAARLEACVQCAVREGVGYTLDIQRVALEGETIRWYHAVGKPVLDGQGKTIRLVGTLHEITEHKTRVEEMQIANDQLVAVNGQLITYGIRIQEQASKFKSQNSDWLSRTPDWTP